MRSQIEQIRLVSWLPKVGVGRIDREKLDRAKPVGEVNRDNRDEEHDCHGNACQRNEEAEKYGEGTKNFNADCHPRQELGCRCPDGAENGSKSVRRAFQLCLAVLYEAATDDEAAWQSETPGPRTRASDVNSEPAKHS
jgi:hypothetical protein